MDISNHFTGMEFRVRRRDGLSTFSTKPNFCKEIFNVIKTAEESNPLLDLTFRIPNPYSLEMRLSLKLRLSWSPSQRLVLGPGRRGKLAREPRLTPVCRETPMTDHVLVNVSWHISSFFSVMSFCEFNDKNRTRKWHHYVIKVFAKEIFYKLIHYWFYWNSLNCH